MTEPGRETARCPHCGWAVGGPVCGHAAHPMPDGSESGRQATPRSWECGDPYSGIGCPEPGCTHDPLNYPPNATMYEVPMGQPQTYGLAGREATGRRAHRPEALDVIEKVQRMVGYVPNGTLDLMNVLAHPDTIALTRRFLDACERDE